MTNTSVPQMLPNKRGVWGDIPGVGRGTDGGAGDGTVPGEHGCESGGRHCGGELEQKRRPEVGRSISISFEEDVAVLFVQVPHLVWFSEEAQRTHQNLPADEQRGFV